MYNVVSKDAKVRNLFKLIRHIREVAPPNKILKGVCKENYEKALSKSMEEDDQDMEEYEEQGEEEEVESDEEVDDCESEPVVAPKKCEKGSTSASSTPRSPCPTTRRRGKTSPDKDEVLFMGTIESAKAVKMREDLKEVLAKIQALKLKS